MWATSRVRAMDVNAQFHFNSLKLLATYYDPASWSYKLMDTENAWLFFFCVKSQQEEIYNHDLKNISFLIPLGIEKYYIYVIFGKTDLELFKVKMEHVLGKWLYVLSLTSHCIFSTFPSFVSSLWRQQQQWYRR